MAQNTFAAKGVWINIRVRISNLKIEKMKQLKCLCTLLAFGLFFQAKAHVKVTYTNDIPNRLMQGNINA